MEKYMSDQYKANFTMRQLFEAGLHYGHRKNFWNPKMSPYIYGVRNGIHIIDLQKTYMLLNSALSVLRDVAIKNGKILFVGTKKQASHVIAENAKRCGQYYVNHRWLGGMLTNWVTVSKSIKTLEKYEAAISDESTTLTKKELLGLSRKRDKLENALGGIRTMGGVPDVLFITDAHSQSIAIQEAKKLKIPVIGVIDTNASLEGINYIIPGNDDSEKSITLYCQLAADAILDGMQISMEKAGVDIGAVENVDALGNIEFEDLQKKTPSDKKGKKFPKNQKVSKPKEGENLAAVAEKKVEKTQDFPVAQPESPAKKSEGVAG